MSCTTKEEDNSCNKEDEHITCTDDMNNMHITCTDEEDDMCACCGKDDSDGLKTCTACKMVKYCNRDCQIAHRPKHKKACRKRAAEMHDIELFKKTLRRKTVQFASCLFHRWIRD